MQGLADGYFIAPATVPAWLAGHGAPPLDTDHPACHEAVEQVRRRMAGLLGNGGGQPVDGFHRRLGRLMIDHCGISREAGGLRAGLAAVAALEQQFLADVRVPGEASGPNPELEKALRVADFFGLAQLMLRDALACEESCGAHFREEHQTPEGEARRDDERFAHIAAWEHGGDGGAPVRHQEPLPFTDLQPSTRSYR
jgi:succinate dehydrogenase / fumarate reductase flavoprotein subunit